MRRKTARITMGDLKKEAQGIAAEIKEIWKEEGESPKFDFAGAVHSYVDGHQWVIYTNHARQIAHNNEMEVLDAVDSMGLGDEYLGSVLSQKGLSGLYSFMAFALIESLVQNALWDDEELSDFL